MNLNPLVEIKTKRIKKNSIVYYKQVKDFCKCPYPLHPNGCPNYNKNPECPTNSPFFEEIKHKFNFFLLIYAEFEFGKYLKIKRKDWTKRNIKITERKLKNVLHWQSSVISILKRKIKRVYDNNKFKKIFLLSSGSGRFYREFKRNQDYVYSMESVGINVFSTLKINKIDFEIKPKNKVVLVSLLLSNEKLRLNTNVNHESIENFLI